MEVQLVSCTRSPESVCYAAAKTCYSEESPYVLALDYILAHSVKTSEEKAKKEKMDALLRDIIKSGHTSVLEHAVFTFSVTGVSRVLTHQLVRHRIASYEQQSARYVNMKDALFVCPPTIAENTQAQMECEQVLDECKALYLRLIAAGIPEEDARYVLPTSMCSNIVITMNARELRHFFSLRCCNRAQWEIRELADKMLEICSNMAPVLFEGCGPGCVNGKCPEGKRSCGVPRVPRN